MNPTKEQISEFLLRTNYSEAKLLEDLKQLEGKNIGIIFGLSSLTEIERVYGSPNGENLIKSLN